MSGGIKGQVADHMNHFVGSSLLEDFSVGKPQTLWESMLPEDQDKWREYNVTHQVKGEAERLAIEVAHEARQNAWREENPDDPWDYCPHVLKYPNYLQPFPKTIVVTDIMVRPIKPLEYISLTFTVPEKGDFQ